MRRRRPLVAAALLLPLTACGTAGPTTAASGTSASSTSSVTTSDTAPTMVSTTAPAPTATSPSEPSSGTSTGATPAPAAGSCGALAASLTPEQRVGQLLMVAIDGAQPADGIDDTLTTHSVGNVFFLGGWTGADRIAATTSHLQSVARTVTPGIAMIVAADQEGGVVHQLRGPSFDGLPRAVEQGQMSSADLTALARRTGAAMKAVGVNLDLAPVADTVPSSVGKANEPIGRWGRQYGSDPATVQRAVVAVTKGLQAGGIGATVKHFPGLGRITGNTDLVADGPRVTDSVATVDDPYLSPFRAGAQAGASVMVSSARYPQIDPANQAVFSRAVVTDLLRGRLGYSGVVMTDDMGVAQAVASVSPGERATRFLAAGGDLVITGRPSNIAPMSAALLTGYADGSLRSAIDASASRVLTYKASLGLAQCTR